MLSSDRIVVRLWVNLVILKIAIWPKVMYVVALTYICKLTHYTIYIKNSQVKIVQGYYVYLLGQRYYRIDSIGGSTG